MPELEIVWGLYVIGLQPESVACEKKSSRSRQDGQVKSAGGKPVYLCFECIRFLMSGKSGTTTLSVSDSLWVGRVGRPRPTAACGWDGRADRLNVADWRNLFGMLWLGGCITLTVAWNLLASRRERVRDGEFREFPIHCGKAESPEGRLQPTP